MSRTMLKELGAPEECVDAICCDFWTEGCGCDSCYGCLADGLEAVNPFMECVADAIWIFGSPLAFPCIFFFDAPKTNPPGGGWQVSMMKTPIKACPQWCFYTICCPCGQFLMRRKLLEGDMSKYKLWQGYHDGPQCCARRCPSAPITIKSGTYGEEKCPNAFLCAEVMCLAGAWSVCCSFDVNRRMIKEQRNLGDDPTEVRVRKCIGFFSGIMSQLYCVGCCMTCCSCLVGCCANDSEGAQECSEEGGRAGRACLSCAHTIWRGIWSVKVIAMGCSSAQMDVEMKKGQPLPSVPTTEKMERGAPDSEGGTLDDDEDKEAWWAKGKK
mmetsp:Transcript_32211/g.78277  ORF Transcript_32211/g.78277 Transcript_32211/m.78277 type:complete len:326 (-) Transcript_32211:98-1075(-)|eukprot:CAMPEP_0113626658 /NCGR_PEP_ID=MMETSP0017_2-20120614/13791_1 /TAXON_ID=2856 /ORGANISM="Cylindrotheca closterium" /LENGTH=325 /DNA_ID=CAMNT_0000536855 /DNA_START=286 /DNA_END=1263 /DNA_ORIENTATION=+ /assembly_acc=CAM_ASM_000147